MPVFSELEMKAGFPTEAWKSLMDPTYADVRENYAFEYKRSSWKKTNQTKTTISQSIGIKWFTPNYVTEIQTLC